MTHGTNEASDRPDDVAAEPAAPTPHHYADPENTIAGPDTVPSRPAGQATTAPDPSYVPWLHEPSLAAAAPSEARPVPQAESAWAPPPFAIPHEPSPAEHHSAPQWPSPPWQDPTPTGNPGQAPARHADPNSIPASPQTPLSYPGTTATEAPAPPAVPLAEPALPAPQAEPSWAPPPSATPHEPSPDRHEPAPHWSYPNPQAATVPDPQAPTAGDPSASYGQADPKAPTAADPSASYGQADPKAPTAADPSAFYGQQPVAAQQPLSPYAPHRAYPPAGTEQGYGAHAAPPYAPGQSSYTDAPVQPTRTPRPEDLLVPNRTPVTAAPASWGWRGRLRQLSGGALKLQAAPAELAARRAIIDIQRGFSRPMTVVVIQPKGGAGKTPTTICLSAAFGAHRGGYVVGWDDNETRGTLAVRVTNPDEQQATVWDLLSDLAAFERTDARVGDLSYYVRSQAEAHFDALVSDDNPANMAQIGEQQFQRLHTVLQRFYRMIVVDTGNNVRSPNWQAAVNAADLVVVVSTYQRDVGYSGSWVLDHLVQTGRADLARNAVTILTAADPTTDKTVREQLLAHFAARTRDVAEVPYDPHIADGGPIRWNGLAEPTRNAWVRAGASIVNALAEHDQKARAARRT